MTIDFLILSMTAFLQLLNTGQHQATDLDRSLIFAESDIRELRKQVQRYETEINLSELITRARNEGRLSCRPIGRTGSRTYTEFFDFLREHKLPTAGFKDLATNNININKKLIYDAAGTSNFSLTIIY